MNRSTLILGALLLSTAALPGLGRAADPPPAAVQEFQIPRTYVALGSSAEADLEKLRVAIGKLAGVEKVHTRPEEDGATVIVDGNGSSSQSLLAAAAKTAGYRLRPAPTRFYFVSGPNEETDQARLRTALGETLGVNQVAMSPLPKGLALRVGGAARNPAIVAAGKTAGFALEPLASYVASGPTEKGDLSRLRTVLSTLPGVTRVEMQSLIGGATLLIHGDTNDDRMAAAGKKGGFIVWPLGDAEGRREFRLRTPTSAADRSKLTKALQAVDGIREVEIHSDPQGDRLVVAGGQIRPPIVVAAANNAGFRVAPEESVSLPTLTPEAERNTPPDYENRVLKDQAQLNGPAPDFSLLSGDGKRTINLSDFAGKRPVVLLFGSCT